MRKINVTIFRHMSQEGLGSLHKILIKRGYEVTYLTTPRANLKSFKALDPDFLLIMGGPIGVYQADDYPFLYEEIRIIKERIAVDKPTMGVCLGAQLIAKALGTEIYPGKNGAELGWHPITMTDAAKGSAFEHIAPENTNMFHWHGDSFDCPEGATLIASSAQYKHQIYTYGSNICGLQCHPEVTEESLEEWYVMLVKDVTGKNAKMPLKSLREDTKKYAKTLAIQTEKFFNQWLNERGL